MKLVFDIETDGFLDVCTQVYVLICQDAETGKIYTFTDHDDKYPSLSDGLDFMARADALIGHNVIGFDLPALDKLFGWTFDKKVFDTWIISQACAYRRTHNHGIKGWGEKFDYPKFEFDDFSQYSDKMREYCQRDVELNTKVYLHLLKEIHMNAQRNENFREGLRIEHDIHKFNTMVKTRGWLFDMDKAQEHVKTLSKEMKRIENAIEPSLPPITKFIDKEPKTPKYTKAGWFTATTARMLSEYLGRTVTAEEGKTLNIQQFQRKNEEPMKLGNLNELKEWLITKGWQPDDYNVKRVGNDWIKTGPKLTSTSLAKLGVLGEDIDKWTTLRNRRSVLEGWIENAKKDNRLRGNMWTIGTPTFRCRHEVIANLPAVDAVFGRELRELFVAEPGYKVVGADSSGNQFRSLCHYVNDSSLTNQVLNEDIHQYNADILGTTRRIAKTWIYAYLFGAGNAKLGKVLNGTQNPNKGKESRDKYSSAIPGLKRLTENLTTLWKQGGYILALDGRKVFVGSDYQCLNYLLQSAEGLTCKAAVSYAMNKIKEEGLDAYPTLFYHDEVAYVAKEEHAERVKEILEESFREGPKLFGVTIMDGEGSIGQTYADVH